VSDVPSQTTKSDSQTTAPVQATATMTPQYNQSGNFSQQTNQSTPFLQQTNQSASVAHSQNALSMPATGTQQTGNNEDELNSSTDFFSFKKKDPAVSSSVTQSGDQSIFQFGMQTGNTTGVQSTSSPPSTMPFSFDSGSLSMASAQAGNQQFLTGSQGFPEMMTGPIVTSSQQQQQQQMLMRQQQAKQQQMMKQLQRQQQQFQKQQQQQLQQLQQQFMQPLAPETQVQENT